MLYAIDPLDEYILSAFIAGTLPDDVRRQVIQQLVHDHDARHLLALATDALASLQDKNGLPPFKSEAA